MYFSGRLPRPPWETRGRVAALVKQYDRAYIQNTGDRFRFHTLQSRYSAFIDLWDRGLRARAEGRGAPFAPTGAQAPVAPRAEHVALNGGVVHEDVAASVALDESVALGVVQPLDLACDTHRSSSCLL